MVSRGGILSGGSADQVQKGIIHKKRELKDLEERAAALEQEAAALGSQRSDLQGQSREVAEGLKSSGTLLHQAELKLAGLRKDRQQATDEISRVDERLAVQGLEAENLQEERQTLEDELKLAMERLATVGSSSLELEQNVALLKSGLETRRTQLAAIRERVTALRVQVATLREQHEAHLRGIADLERQAQDLARRMTSDHEDTEKGVDERLQLQTAISSGTQQLEGFLRQQITAEARLTDVRAAYETAGSGLAELEKQARQLRENGDSVRQSQAELNLRFLTVSMHAEHLEQGLMEKSRIPMAEALARLEAVEFDETARRTRQIDLASQWTPLLQPNRWSSVRLHGRSIRNV